MKWWNKILKHQNLILALLFLAANILLLLPVLGKNQFFPSHDDTWIIRLQQFDRAIKLGQIPPRLAPDMAFGLAIRFCLLRLFLLSFPDFENCWFYSLAVVLTIIFVNFLGTWGCFFSQKFFGTKGGVIAALAFTFLPYRALIFMCGEP